MKLSMIAEGRLGELGHLAKDIGGLIPGIGEPIDLSNALSYADEGRYFESVLSLISMIPAAGDMIGKGFKYLGKYGKLPAKFMAKYGDDIVRHWSTIKEWLIQMEDWREHAGMMDDVIQKIKAVSIKNKNTGEAPA